MTIHLSQSLNDKVQDLNNFLKSCHAWIRDDISIPFVKATSTFINEHQLFTSEKTSKYAFYAAFTLVTRGAHLLFQHLLPGQSILPFIAMGTVGGLIQGYPQCPAQKNIEENHPTAAFFSGFFNAVIGCKAYEFATCYLGALAGSFTHLAICGKFMCKFESVINNIAEFASPTIKETISQSVKVKSHSRRNSALDLDKPGNISRGRKLE